MDIIGRLKGDPEEKPIDQRLVVPDVEIVDAEIRPIRATRRRIGRMGSARLTSTGTSSTTRCAPSPAATYSPCPVACTGWATAGSHRPTRTAGRCATTSSSTADGRT